MQYINAATLNLLLNPKKCSSNLVGLNQGCVHLTECVFLIITDVVSFQKRFIFVMKTLHPVMFFLLLYVVYGLVKQRRADGKSPVAVHALDDTADILENARKILFPHWNTRAFHMEHEVDVDFYQ